MTGAPTLSPGDLDREELLALLARVAPVGSLRQRDLWAVRAARLHDRASKALDDYSAAALATEAAFDDGLAAKTARGRLAADTALVRAQERRRRAWATYQRHSRAADDAWAASSASEDTP